MSTKDEFVRPRPKTLELIGFLPSESALLRMSKTQIISYLYLAVKEWDKSEQHHLEYANVMTMKLNRALHPDAVIFDD